MEPPRFTDLRDFIDFLSDHDQIRTLVGADWKYDIGGLTELVVREHAQPPALLFDEINGYEKGFRVLTNMVNNAFQWTAARGYEPTDDVQTAITSHKDHIRNQPEGEPPTEVAGGPVTENVLRDEEVDVTSFPAPHYREKDGGRYVGTACVVITEHAETGAVNAGTYRCQVHGPSRVTAFISPGKDGRINMNSFLDDDEPCPFVISAGQAPDLFLAANERLPVDVNELEFAGGLRGEPVEVVRGEVTGLPIPASAELVLEGHLYPESEPVVEGPFGEYHGYYAGGSHEEGGHRIRPITVERIYHRDDPIITGSPPLRPPAAARSQIRKAAQLWTELDNSGIPGIVGVNSFPFGPGWFEVIAVDQQYGGHSTQVGLHAASGPAGAYLGRFTVVVDEDVNIFDQDEVLWAVCSRCDPAEDMHLLENCWSSPLDPRIHPERKRNGDFTNSRMVIDATRPYHWFDDYPEVNDMSEELRSQLIETWGNEIR